MVMCARGFRLAGELGTRAFYHGDDITLKVDVFHNPLFTYLEKN